MKKSLLLLSTLSLSLFAESNSKGGNSPISVGVIKSISEDQQSIQIRQGGDIDRTLNIPNPNVLHFVGMPESSRQLKVGYGIKAKVQNNTINSAKVTLPLKDSADLGPNKTKMSPSDIFQKTDENGDGMIDYVEMSRWVYLSPKHGPDKFSGADKNQDGGLNEPEFTPLLQEVSWYKLSRKTPEDWFAQADTNQDQALSLQEYKAISTSKNHVENHFKRNDTDKNGSLSLEELTSSLEGGKKKKKKKK